MEIITAKEFLAEYDFMDLNRDWALASADDGRERNCLTVAWASIGYLWREPTLTLYIHKDRYSQHIFDKAPYFSFSIFPPEYHEALVYAGKVSGKDEDKMKGIGLTLRLDEETGTPYFLEARYTIISETMGRAEFDLAEISEKTSVYDWYKERGVHRLYEGKIIKIIKH